ncbi:MAG: YaeQ family protein [Leptothrix sp. (in: b-proteobacteria)]
MALKATIHKAQLQIADMDRGVYADHALTIARHPSETDERMLIRVLALALWAPADDHRGALELAKSLWDTDEPDLWQRDLTGELIHWVEVGQPDDRRLMKASSRAEQVSVLSFSASTPIWWAALSSKLTRAPKVAVWQIDAEQSQALAALCERSMQWQVSIQDGTVWISSERGNVEITPRLLKARG